MNNQELENLLEKLNVNKETQILFDEYRLTELGRSQAEIDEFKCKDASAECQKNYDNDLDKFRYFIKQVECLDEECGYIDRLHIARLSHDSCTKISHHGLTCKGKATLEKLKSPLEKE
jgi:hypothetical protein